ncbi:MAG: hypothetical protein HOP21_05325 [Methylotenera sp.]|nr:hypothetical protein [Methylotenera sp.]
MSLLIKALANAEKDKQVGQQNKQVTLPAAAEALSLTPMVDEVVPTDAFSVMNVPSATHPSHATAQAAYHPTANHVADNHQTTHQKAAASVFVANQSAKAPSSITALLLLGVAGALLVWLGIQGYHYLSVLSAPEVVLVKPAAPAPVVSNLAEPIVAPNPSSEPESSNDMALEASQAAQAEEPKTSLAASTEAALIANETIVDEVKIKPRKVLPPKPAMHDGNTDALDSVSAEPVLQSTTKTEATRNPLKLVSKTPAAGVDPVLMAAYQAFSRGEDANAQQQYRQVLQRDVRNVDALLGMAAIAQRQGREADAAGWYQKVLEIEPRNTIAQSALASAQGNADGVRRDVIDAESRIKSMLAQQPDAANLHAALGNLYAEQNQWASAQGAYFNASRYAPNSADYAFNLAVSLEHLGKTSLALAQYQRALALVSSTGAASPDKLTLEARISALQ